MQDRMTVHRTHGAPDLCEIGGCQYEPHLWICQNVIKHLRFTAVMTGHSAATRLMDTYRRSGLTEEEFDALPRADQQLVYVLIKLTVARMQEAES